MLYPEDEKYLLGESTIVHHEVVDVVWPPAGGSPDPVEDLERPPPGVRPPGSMRT